MSKLQILLDQAQGWQTAKSILNKEGCPKSEYRDWQDNVKTTLRDMPHAYDNLKKFIRLQRSHNYAWYPDLAGPEDRDELVEKSIDQSIEFLEEIIEDS